MVAKYKKLWPPSCDPSVGPIDSTGNDRYSGHGYSGIDRFSGTKNPDDAILFTVSGITAIVEQKFQFFPKILMNI